MPERVKPGKAVYKIMCVFFFIKFTLILTISFRCKKAKKPGGPIHSLSDGVCRTIRAKRARRDCFATKVR